MATNILEMSGIWYNAAKNMEFYHKVCTKFNISVNTLKLIDKRISISYLKIDLNIGNHSVVCQKFPRKQ